MPSWLNSALSIGASLGTILLGVFYVAIILWTYKDARRRVEDPILIATAVATSMLPLVGVLVYMMLRPPEYLADVRERELEIRAMERELGRQERCPYCRSHIEGDYRSCPVCMTKLRESCTGCAKPLDPRWAMCPFCETEVPRSAALDMQRGGGRGRRGGRGSQPATPTSNDRTRESGQGKRPTAPPRGRADDSPAARPARPARPAREAAPTKREDTARPVKRADPGLPATPASDEPRRDGIQIEPFQSLSPETQRFVRSTDQPTMAGRTPHPPEH